MSLFGTVGEDGTITHPDTCANTGLSLRRNTGYKRINLPSHPNAFVGVQPGIRIRPGRLEELDALYAASLPTPSPDETPEPVTDDDAPKAPAKRKTTKKD